MPASLARPVSQRIQALRLLLQLRPGFSRRLASHTGYTALMNTFLEPPPPQRRMGCFAKGCLILLCFFALLFVAFIGGTYVAIRYLKTEYLPRNRTELPAATP